MSPAIHPTRRWPADKLRILVALNARRRSATEIAHELGVTRAAVLGKLHRLGRRSYGIGGNPRTPLTILEQPEASTA